MKQTLLTLATLLSITLVKAQQQQQQEPSTFHKHDTVKVVLRKLEDATSLKETPVRAYKLFEVRKGDQSGKLYYLPKSYITAHFQPLKIDPLYIILPDGQLLEQYVDWQLPADPKKN